MKTDYKCNPKIVATVESLTYILASNNPFVCLLDIIN